MYLVQFSDKSVKVDTINIHILCGYQLGTSVELRLPHQKSMQIIESMWLFVFISWSSMSYIMRKSKN